MVTRWPWLMAHNPRICPMRITPCPPNPEIRISVRVLVGAWVVMSMRSFPRASGAHTLLHPLLQVAQEFGTFRASVTSVVLDAGLPPEVAVTAVGLPARRMLFDPLQILQGVPRPEGVGAKIFVTREAHMDEGEAVVLQRFLKDFDALGPLRRRGLRHEGRAGR